MKKPLRSVFLLAAENISPQGELFTCIAVRQAHADMNNKWYIDSQDCPEMKMFQELFQPEGCSSRVPWWPPEGVWPDHIHDYESRILALLLCAEICGEPKQSFFSWLGGLLRDLSDQCIKSKRVF